MVVVAVGLVAAASVETLLERFRRLCFSIVLRRAFRVYGQKTVLAETPYQLAENRENAICLAKSCRYAVAVRTRAVRSEERHLAQDVKGRCLSHWLLLRRWKCCLFQCNQCGELFEPPLDRFGYASICRIHIFSRYEKCSRVSPTARPSFPLAL